MKGGKSMDSHREIEDHAAALLARRDSGDWTDADQAHLEEWMAGSTARRVAVLRLEAGWENARRLRALGAGLPLAAVVTSAASTASLSTCCGTRPKPKT